MNDAPGYQVGTSANNEKQIIATVQIVFQAISFQQAAYQHGKEYTTHGARHATDAYYRADGSFGKHVRSKGENIGTPCLVYGHCQAQQCNCRPHIGDELYKYYGELYNGKDQHHAFSCFYGRPSFFDEPGRKNTT